MLSNIKEVRVPVEVVLGGTSISLEDFSTIGRGTILELNKEAGKPVTLVAAGKEIAMGEVVVIDDKFGIRITDLLDERS